MEGFAPFEEKMKADGMSDSAIAAFKYNYESLVSGKSLMVGESEIDPVESLPTLAEIKGEYNFASSDEGKDILAKTAVFKLNGGLGTGMGLEKAKSLLEVKKGHTFLDFIAKQVVHMRETIGARVRFILMNSFSTSADTKEYLSKDYSPLLEEADVELVQNKSPKVDAATMGPATWEKDAEKEWCPPGHGDIYASLAGSGMLDRLLADGLKYIFVSNSDNLGATLDLDLLLYFAKSDKPFLMEVADRTAADKKGGHLCFNKSGNLILREAAQCSDEDEPAFQDITKYKYFNTNNLWINLEKLKAVMEANGGVMPLPLIKNGKTVDPRDKKSPKVFQLETAMGAAIQAFEGAGAVVVPRTRFAPVKTCSDLFSLRSNAYKITPDHTMVLATAEEVGQPVVKLDDSHYKMVDQMEALVEEPPVMEFCKSLTVKGAVKFERNVVLVGKVTVTNASSETKTLHGGVYQNTSVDL